VPAADASTDALFAFLGKASGLGAYTDQRLEPVVPFYYQAGTELGYSTFPQDHLAGLLRYPGQVVPRSYVPAQIPMTYQPGVMADVDTWVRTEGSRLMFVYGENDPWGAEPYRPGPGTRDSVSYTVPGANHYADLSMLPAAARAEATATLRRWAGVPADTRPGTLPAEDRSALRRPL
jgi:hypothetical protein